MKMGDNREEFANEVLDALCETIWTNRHIGEHECHLAGQIADKLAPALAHIWDQGHDRGVADGQCNKPRMVCNPYLEPTEWKLEWPQEDQRRREARK